MTNENRISEVRTTQQNSKQDQRVLTFKATQLVWLVFGILEAMIAIRIGLKLIGANLASPIVALIYGITDLFLFPFNGLVGSPATGNMVLELSSMFAMLIYGLIAWVMERMVWLIFCRSRGDVVGTTQTTTSEQHTTP